jgi:hypothetical protein
MTRKRALTYALTAMLTLAGACSKDKSTSTEPTGTTLSANEAASLTNALNAIGLFNFAADPSNPGTLNAARASSGLAAQTAQTISVNSTKACPGGGNFAVSGSYSYSLSGNNATLSGTVNETPSGCKGSGGDGTTWTLNGNPRLTLSINETVNSSTGAVSATFHETGGVSFSTTSKSGSCSIDVNITYSYTAGAVSGHYSGTVCGQTLGTQNF